MERSVRIEDVMIESRVTFGTSGARGVARDMTDAVCFAYTAGFIQYLEKIGELTPGTRIAVGGDLRGSTDRIMDAVSQAVRYRGHIPVNCGKLPTPAVAYFGLLEGIPTVTVTGSHIPEDRNGIKFTKTAGEILKPDEAGIKSQTVTLPDGVFDESGGFLFPPASPPVDTVPGNLYERRYLDFFPADCLSGQRIGVFQHSAVGRDLLPAILSGLGAEVTPLGFSDTFMPVDTEAIRPEDVRAAAKWAAEYRFDAIVSTDGDSDRPLVSDETGKWLRGDVAGILCAAYFQADAVVTPVSCNSAVEKCGWFPTVIRTRIGSPYVIEGMLQAIAQGARRVVGYEANGGFLLASDIRSTGRTLQALPTRDAVILILAILRLAREKRKPISHLAAELPQRFTFSNRLKDFPTETSRAKLAELYPGDADESRRRLTSVFGDHLGPVAGIDTTDGLRITFASGEVVHLRPSGNAPEFRCYTEADTERRAAAINRICMDIMAGWR